MARYLLHRLSEQFDVVVSLDSGLFPGSVSGSSFSFNTKTMRSPLGGLQAANEALEKARNSDDAYQGKLSFAGYPSDLKRRIQKGSSVVTFDVTIKEDADGNGFALLDRRPPSNLNPYVLCEEIIRSICL